MILTWILGSAALSYLIGSIPFGLLLTHAAGLGDVRKIGSGNIGATNVMRTGRKGLGILTLLLDASKGAVAIGLTRHFFIEEMSIVAGLFVVIGHIFPLWLGFKGGKGVATALGVMFTLNWEVGMFVCMLWLLVFAFTRYSSLSSLISIGYSSVVAYLLDNYLVSLLCLCIAALVILTHRQNIKRLVQGTEYAFRKKAA